MARRIIEAAHNTTGVIQKQPSLSLNVSILGERLIGLKETIDWVEKEIADLRSEELSYRAYPLPSYHHLRDREYSSFLHSEAVSIPF